MEHQEHMIDSAKFPSFEPDGEAQVSPDAYDQAIRRALNKYAKRPVMAMMDAFPPAPAMYPGVGRSPAAPMMLMITPFPRAFMLASAARHVLM